MKFLKFLKFATPLVLLILITVWFLDRNKAKQSQQIKAAQQTFIPTVQTVEVTRQSFQGNIPFIGKTEFLKEIVMTATTQGVVKELYFNLNGSISQGATMLKVDTDLNNSTVDIAQINLEKAKIDLKRLVFLKTENNVAGSEVETARLQVQMLENQIYQLKRQGQDALVKSPITGIVTEKSIEKGMFITQGSPIATITDVSSIKLKVFVPEIDLSKWIIGSSVPVSFEMYPNETFKGKIYHIALKGGDAGRFPVEVIIPNSTRKMLRVGMTGQVFKSTQRIDNQLVIPRIALSLKENTSFVYVVENGKLIRKTVEIGQVFDNLVVILKGLDKGQKVVVSGTENISNGQAVNAN